MIPQLFKTEYSKMIAVLCNLFGIVHMEIAEDIVNDTFLLASETWGLHSIPENPKAWLYTVAKNKTKDYFKRNKIFKDKIEPEINRTYLFFEETEFDFTDNNINDSQLLMIFAICNPQIPYEAQVGLALRILCGFSIDQIAEAFLTNKETINKRLFRAKEKLRIENINMHFTNDIDLENRLESVLTTLYLLFNEGYHSSTQNEVLNKELCLEAMRLNYFLIENESTNKPITNALMSLMCFHASRFEARQNNEGEIVLYEDQNKALWNEDLIARGNYFLIESAKGQSVSKYHIEASIAYWHCTKIETKNKWENILQLYNQLLQIEYSPITALNRTYALSKVKGKESAIVEAEKLDLVKHHLYFALLGNLYTDIDNQKACEHYEKAFSLAHSEKDKLVLKKKMSALQSN